MKPVFSSAANAGVLIEYGGVRLLLDGIRRAPFAPFLPTPPQILDEMLRGAETSRWRNVDYLLFSHLHPDHFDEAAVQAYLAANRVREIFAPEWPFAAQGAAKINAFPLSNGGRRDFALVPDLALRAIGTAHAGEQFASVRNHAYLLTLGETRILFVGDGDYVPDWYRAAGTVDAVFVNPLFLNSRAMPEVARLLAPQTVYVYHLPAPDDDIQAQFYRRVAERGAKRLDVPTVFFE